MTSGIRIYAGLLFAIGAALIAGGTHLVSLHGSAYYLLCGIALVGSAILLWRGRAEGAALYVLTWLATLAWTLWEAGFDGWALMPRILAFAIIGVGLGIPQLRRG